MTVLADFTVHKKNDWKKMAAKHFSQIWLEQCSSMDYMYGAY